MLRVVQAGQQVAGPLVQLRPGPLQFGHARLENGKCSGARLESRCRRNHAVRVLPHMLHVAAQIVEQRDLAANVSDRVLNSREPAAGLGVAYLRLFDLGSRPAQLLQGVAYLFSRSAQRRDVAHRLADLTARRLDPLQTLLNFGCGVLRTVHPLVHRLDPLDLFTELGQFGRHRGDSCSDRVGLIVCRRNLAHRTVQRPEPRLQLRRAIADVHDTLIDGFEVAAVEPEPLVAKPYFILQTIELLSERVVVRIDLCLCVAQICGPSRNLAVQSLQPFQARVRLLDLFDLLLRLLHLPTETLLYVRQVSHLGLSPVDDLSLHLQRSRFLRHVIRQRPQRVEMPLGARRHLLGLVQITHGGFDR